MRRLKIIVLLTCCLLIGFTSQAQRFSFEAGLGVGKPIPNKKVNADRGFFIYNLAGYYHLSKGFEVGLELMGSRTPAFMTFVPIRRTYDEASNTETIDPSNLSSRAWFVKVRKQWKRNVVHPFVGLGCGINTYFLKEPVSDVDEVRKRNLSWLPEAGFTIGKFYLSGRVLMGGDTPAFNAIEAKSVYSPSPVNVIMQSVTINAWQVTTGLRFGFGKVKAKPARE